MFAGVTVLAFDRNSRGGAGSEGEGIDAALDAASLREQPNGRIFIAQQINLHCGDAYLYVAI